MKRESKLISDNRRYEATGVERVCRNYHALVKRCVSNETGGIHQFELCSADKIEGSQKCELCSDKFNIERWHCEQCQT